MPSCAGAEPAAPPRTASATGLEAGAKVGEQMAEHIVAFCYGNFRATASRGTSSRIEDKVVHAETTDCNLKRLSRVAFALGTTVLNRLEALQQNLCGRQIVDRWRRRRQFPETSR